MAEITTRMKNLMARHPDFYKEAVWDYGLLLGIKARLRGKKIHEDILTIERRANDKENIDLELELRRAVHAHWMRRD